MMCFSFKAAHISNLPVPSFCTLLSILQDLAQYVNEVKRDNETLREIKQFQLSIENLVCNYPPIQIPPPIPKSRDIQELLLRKRQFTFNFQLLKVVFSPPISVWSPHSCDVSWDFAIGQVLPPSLSFLLPRVPENNKVSPSFGNMARESPFQTLVILTGSKE